jgi:DNA repair protein RadC
MEIEVISLALAVDRKLDIQMDTPYVYSVNNAKSIFYDLIGKRNVETVGLLCLDNANKIINLSIVSSGAVTSVRVQISQIFRVALLSNAVKMMIAHNHPSGVITPTSIDFSMTRKIGQIAKVFDMELLDSLIIGYDGQVVSIRDNLPKTEIGDD